jgi:hypothetical protein
MAAYFVIFGIRDLADVTGGGFIALAPSDLPIGSALDSAILGRSDWVVLVGAATFLAGYFFLFKFTERRTSQFLAYEWRRSTIFTIGVILWLIGITLSIAYDMTVTPAYLPTSILGLPVGIASNLRLLAQLGSIMLIYLALQGSTNRMAWGILLAVICVEFIFGFLANSKETSFRTPVLLLLGSYFLHGRLNKTLLSIIILAFIPYLLFFNAYRLNVLQEQNQSQRQVLERLDDNLDTVLINTKSQTNIASSSLNALIQRVNGKVYVDIIVAGLESGSVSRLNGESLVWFLSSFVPRALWQGKPEISLGRRFNLEFDLSASRYTYVPTTQLGELYWNFGFPGVVVGMFALGMILGYLSSLLSESKRITICRFLTLLMATYLLAIRFESNIALQYSSFVRVLLLIGLIDYLFRIIGLSRRQSSPRFG